MSITATQPVRIDVHAGPTSPGTTTDWELQFARRALATLKARLGRQGLLELLRGDIDASSEEFARYLAESDGRWQLSQTELRVTGLSTEEFLTHFESISHDEPRMTAVHPEHFVMAAIDGGIKVVENLGPFITEIDVRFGVTDQAEDTVSTPHPDYPRRMLGKAALPTGDTAAHVQHQFRDTADGFDVLLGIHFPAAAPEEIVETHRKHLAVEFTNWITDAARTLGRAVGSV